MLYSMNVNAQFVAGSATEYAFGVSSLQARHTGCDILDISGDVYRVSTWEPAGTSSGFGWSVNAGSSYSGYLALGVTTNVFHPDVCLVYNGSTVYAIVAYFQDVSGGFGRWIWDAYRWSGFTNSFVAFSQGNNITTGQFGTTVNIDGNNSTQGGFVIVFDKIISGNELVYAAAGEIVSGTPAVYSPVKIADGKSPDVSLFYDGTDNIAHVAYLDALNSYDLTVDDHDLTDLISSTNNGTVLFNVGPFYDTYYRPRIACPNGSSGTATNFTVVVEDNDGIISPYYIIGYNDATGTTPIVYNDGTSNSPYDLKSEINYAISIAYDSNYPSDGIWVGWTVDNSSNNFPASADAIFPIVLKCDNAGQIISADYWEVPNNLNSGDFCDFVSLAGRYANDELYVSYAVYDLGGSSIQDVFRKEISSISSATSLRQVSNYPNSLPAYQSINHLLNDIDNTEIATVTVYDVMGRLVFFHTGELNEIVRGISTLSKTNSASLYFLTVRLQRTYEVITGKLLITEKP